MVNDLDMVTCPHCGEITHIGGLIGEYTDDCPRCGTNVFGSWPFPTSLRPQKHGLPKYNPNNEEEAPI